MIACYCRVSSKSQKNDSQRAEIRRWLKGHDIEADAVTWFEDKESAKSLERPALAAMQEAIFSGNVKTVVVWKLDRISRNLQDGINLLAGWCDRGVRVVSVTQQIDMSGAVGRMVASVMFGLAEIELEYRRERQAAGIRVAQGKGVYQGRKKGTTKAKPARARELQEQGLTTSEIATVLGVSARTVFRYLVAVGEKE
ncbi:MAG: recombinase family protein [Candidatus Hydrogenedentes bacterium]|nr:recombinase family protein [Candidatus Hydrogenedentota bacterium]